MEEALYSFAGGVICSSDIALKGSSATGLEGGCPACGKLQGRAWKKAALLSWMAKKVICNQKFTISTLVYVIMITFSRADSVNKFR
jgi:hypothetical protein